MAERDPSKVSWMGRRLTDLTREELINVVLILQNQFEESASNFEALADLNQKIIERHGSR